jgi:hypothetical protein
MIVRYALYKRFIFVRSFYVKMTKDLPRYRQIHRLTKEIVNYISDTSFFFNRGMM